MGTVLIDGGYFVGRFEKHWSRHGKKNMRYWWEAGKRREITKEELFSHLNRIFSYDISYLRMRINEMDFPCRVIVCYDGVYGRRPRGNLYAEYKMNRRGSVEAHQHKGIDVRERIIKCGYDPNALDLWWSSDYDELMEADDLIAELCNALPRSEEIVVMSKDQDLFQLLELENVRIHDFTKMITREDFIEKFGILPEQYVDYKALAGDASDNIPGVKGIGGKTARKLLRKYGDLDSIPEEELKGYSRENIEIWRRITQIPYHSA